MITNTEIANILKENVDNEKVMHVREIADSRIFELITENLNQQQIATLAEMLDSDVDKAEIKKWLKHIWPVYEELEDNIIADYAHELAELKS